MPEVLIVPITVGLRPKAPKGLPERCKHLLGAQLTPKGSPLRPVKPSPEGPRLTASQGGGYEPATAPATKEAEKNYSGFSLFLYFIPIMMVWTVSTYSLMPPERRAAEGGADGSAVKRPLTSTLASLLPLWGSPRLTFAPPPEP